MIEVETKYRVRDRRDLEQRLQELARDRGSDDSHEDTLYDHPLLNLKGQTLRLRKYAVGGELTYKGRVLSLEPKTRTEFNVHLEDRDAQTLRRLLAALGFAVALCYRKQRRSFAVHRDGGRLAVCIDHIDGVGDFAEIEAGGDCPDPAATIAAVAAELRLTEVEHRSYPQLVRESQK